MWQSLLAVVDADENGQVDWTELVQFIGEVFMHIEREKALQGALEKHASSAETQDTAAVHVIMDTEPAAQEAEAAIARKTRESQDVVQAQVETDGRDAVQLETGSQ